MQHANSTRPEVADDAPFRLALFRETQGGMLAALDPALAESLLRQQIAGQAMTYAARYPDARYEIVQVDGAPIGRMVSHRSTEAVTLVDIALLTAWRGRGIGTRLLRELISAASEAGVSVRLSVRIGNPARRLYERLGFVAVETGQDEANAIDVAMERPPTPLG